MGNNICSTCKDKSNLNPNEVTMNENDMYKVSNLNTSEINDSMNLHNLKAKYRNNNNGGSKSDLSKTNIYYEAEIKDNSGILNNEKPRVNGNKELNREENKENEDLRKLVLVQLAFKKFLAIKQRKKLREEKEKLMKQKDYYCTDHLRDYLNVNNRKGVSVRVIRMKNSYRYIGGVKNEKKEGFGVKKWVDNSKYVGIFKEDFVEGIGKFRYADGRSHLGFFKENKANGFGFISKIQDELMYQGEFLNDKKHGIGLDYLDSAVSYRGEFKHDERCGMGSIVYSENAFYLGEWSHGLHNGFGIYTFPDNSVYQGEWLDGRMHGYGEYHNIEANILYIGMFEENLYSGFGILRSFSEDEIYVGYFKRHLKEGVGRTVGKDSDVIARYTKNIEIQQYTHEDNIERLVYDHHQHLVKFFFCSMKDLKKFASLARILSDK